MFYLDEIQLIVIGIFWKPSKFMFLVFFLISYFCLSNVNSPSELQLKKNKRTHRGGT
jgi:hypothetical protein